MHKSTFLFSVTPTILTKLSQLNLDSVFTGFNNATKQNIESLKKEKSNDFEIYVDVGVFAGADLLGKYPDAKPVEVTGKETTNGWYTGLCPTHEGVRSAALDKVERATKKDIDGIWLDFIRYPMHWEEKNPEVLDTCYCDRCLKLFEEYIGEPISGVGGEGNDLENLALHIDGSYYHEWLEFKTGQITSFVEDARKIIDESAKKIKLGFFAIPWTDKEYGAGIKRIMGQDFDKLSGLVDIFSPMLYHKMLEKDVSWVGEMIDYFWQVGKPFLPLIQTEDKPTKLVQKEFEDALTLATKKPSFGVCAFYFDDLIKSNEKFETLEKFFSN